MRKLHYNTLKKKNYSIIIEKIFLKKKNYSITQENNRLWFQNVMNRIYQNENSFVTLNLSFYIKSFKKFFIFNIYKVSDCMIDF